MIYPGTRKWVILYPSAILLPVVAALLTAPIKPLICQSYSLIVEPAKTAYVTAYTIILVMSSKLLA